MNISFFNSGSFCMCSNVLPLFLGVQLQQEFHLGHSGSQFVLQGSPKLFDEIIQTSFVQVFSMSCAIEEFRGCEVVTWFSSVAEELQVSTTDTSWLIIEIPNLISSFVLALDRVWSQEYRLVDGHSWVLLLLGAVSVEEKLMRNEGTKLLPFF